MEKEINEIYNELLNNMVLPDKKYKSPFIITMCGHVGSGKSTIAKILSKELSAYIVGGDKIRNIYYLDEKANHDIVHINKVVDAVTTKEVQYLLSNGVSIIFDRSVSSKKNLASLKEACNNVIAINLISDHKINLERIKKRDENNIVISGCYGDVEPESGVTTEEVYNEILNRKVYDLEDNDFDYTIDTTKSIESVIKQANDIADKIKDKYIKD